MSKTNDKTSIEKFLSSLAGSKEVGLVIANNQIEYKKFAKILHDLGFHKSDNVTDILKVKKTYFTINQNTEKEVYDFVVQYPTGQIEIFDKKIMQSHIFSPNYKDSAVVLLVDQDSLNKLQAKGFNFLSASGPAYRS